MKHFSLKLSLCTFAQLRVSGFTVSSNFLRSRCDSKRNESIRLNYAGKVWAKRQPQKRQERKLAKREEFREFQEEQRVANELLLAKPTPIPPPQNQTEAEERLIGSMETLKESVANLKSLKFEARNSPSYIKDIGYKAFPQVIAAMKAVDSSKAVVHEARLEAALLQLSEITGKHRSLEDFSWRFGAGTETNAACCSYMLRACQKGGAVGVASELLSVLEEADAMQSVDEKVLSFWKALVK
mmetsp:Transcript_20443/g.28321  ORF Transcript_20443/g.28321 Transcript_20443/m.28321 type:complete len:241 (+) Transcript_20443:327-1049(+)